MKLILNNITMSFGSHQILNNASAEANTGDVIAIVGQNGAGKTTLFELLSGTLTPTAGSISLENSTPCWQTSTIGRLFQNTLLGCAPNLTVRENIALACLKNKTARPKHALTGSNYAYEKITKEFDYNLAPLLDKKMKSLSGGQRQLISFFLLTLNEPAILLLDEPTAALDPSAATSLIQKTMAWARKKPMIIFLVTHDIELAKTVSSHIWIIANTTIEQYKTNAITKELASRLQPINYDSLKGSL